MSGTTWILKRTWFGLAAGLTVVMAIAAPALAQCPNNCTGHGTCVPSQKTKRFECACYDGWVGSACSQRESAAAKAKKESEVVVDVPEEDTEANPEHGGKRQSGVRHFEEVVKTSWSDLQPREQSLLKQLGWRKDTWNSRNSGRTQWPPTMYMPYEVLKKPEQSAVGGLGFTPKDWNSGKHVAILQGDY